MKNYKKYESKIAKIAKQKIKLTQLQDVAIIHKKLRYENIKKDKTRQLETFIWKYNEAGAKAFLRFELKRVKDELFLIRFRKQFNKQIKKLGAKENKQQMKFSFGYSDRINHIKIFSVDTVSFKQLLNNEVFIKLLQYKFIYIGNIDININIIMNENSIHLSKIKEINLRKLI